MPPMPNFKPVSAAGASPEPPVQDCCPVLVAHVVVSPPIAFEVESASWGLQNRPANFNAIVAAFNGNPNDQNGFIWPQAPFFPGPWYMNSPDGPTPGDGIFIDPGATWLTAIFTPAGPTIWTLLLDTSGPGFPVDTVVHVRWKGQDGLLYVHPDGSAA